MHNIKVVLKPFVFLSFFLGMTLTAGAQGVPSGNFPALREVLPFLPTSDLVKLENGEELTRFAMGSFKPELPPATRLGRETAAMAVKGGLTVGTEALFLFTGYRGKPEDLLLECYNILSSVSTLKGIEYWSASRKRMRILFEEAWVTDGPKSKKKLPDPLVDEIPATRSLFIHQKDSTFGSAECRMDFRFEDNEISAVIINLTPMYYGIIKAMDPEAMQMHILIVPVEEGILFYGISAGKTLNMKIFEEKAQKSFYNRIRALYGWFTGRISR
jgi:hypothetical protein